VKERGEEEQQEPAQSGPYSSELISSFRGWSPGPDRGAVGSSLQRTKPLLNSKMLNSGFRESVNNVLGELSTGRDETWKRSWNPTVKWDVTPIVGHGLWSRKKGSMPLSIIVDCQEEQILF
jgi:hypothetical protein